MTALQNRHPGSDDGAQTVEGRGRERAVPLERSGSGKIDSYPSSCPVVSTASAIARALAMQPKIMLFDEATSALDRSRRRGAECHSALADEGMTWSSSRTKCCSPARSPPDHLMDEGLVVEEGNPQAMFTSPRTEELRPTCVASRTTSHRENIVRLALVRSRVVLAFAVTRPGRGSCSPPPPVAAPARSSLALLYLRGVFSDS